MKIVDLHTDFILGEAKLDTLFGVNTSSQINASLLEKTEVSTILAGFSYDDELGKTELMFLETEKFIRSSKSVFKVFPHLEGAQILANDPSLFEKYVERGLKSIGLAHTHDNGLCGSSSGISQEGLSTKGKNLVKKSLRRGLLVDMAHMSKKSVMDTLKILDKPPVVSHTASFSVEGNPRNTTDEQIRTISKLGGVIGIFFSGKYINSKSPPTIQDVANHMDHLVQTGGIEVAAIGSDFGGITTGTPKGLENVTKLEDLLNILKNRGYKNADLEKIAYKNAERVLSQYLNVKN